MSNVFKGVTNFGVDLAKGGFNAVRGIGLNLFKSANSAFSGISNIFSGNFTQGVKDIGRSVIKTTLQTPIDAIIAGIGNPLLSIGAKSESLSDKQKIIAREIFDESINLDSVRIKTVANWVSGGFSSYARALVIGNDILVPQKQDLKGLPDIHNDQELFNHELTHIWQHQNGGTNYLTEALYAQGLGDGYDIHKGLTEDKKFAELNPEQQGEMVKMIYQRKNLSRQQRASDCFPSDIVTDSQIEEALYSIRNGLGAP